MPRLPDGAVTSLPMGSTDQFNPVARAQFNNSTVRVGYVIRRYEPAHNGNRNKSAWEYDVIAAHRDGLGPTSYTTYFRCVALCRYGQKENFGDVIYDADTELDQQTHLPKKFGTAVLLLCVNGASDFPVIIGSLHHPQRKAAKAADHDIWKYRGLQREVDKDGSYTLTFNGAKNKWDTELFLNAEDGSFQFTDTGGNSIFMDPNGIMEVDISESIKLTTQALEITNGTKPSYPVWRADPSHVSSLKNLLSTLSSLASALSSLSAALTGLSGGIAAEPLLGPAKAAAPAVASAAATVISATAAVTAAISTHTPTLESGIAISETAKTT